MPIQLITEKKAAEIMAIPSGTLRYWRCQRAGRGPNYVRLGGRIKYDLAEVEAYINRHRHTSELSVRAETRGAHGTVQAAR